MSFCLIFAGDKLYCHAELGSASFQLGVILAFGQDPETSSGGHYSYISSILCVKLCISPICRLLISGLVYVIL